ncbi:hypothetical protein L1987_53700 [Smallanthus sonchifolius]|uniref:Uncharacterized protein n=1 Tax=Smallanthus sonchifolius TaxID=185202 RepID=A0ACB9EWZ7_9ASTR|nr:hypothetical protein L1987_53700 [Smallanthus sonchifolius]
MFIIFFLLLCAQFLTTLALESKDEKNPINIKGNEVNKEEGLKRDALVFSKATKAKGTSGAQNDHTKQSNAISMFIKTHTRVSNVGIGVIVVGMMFVLNF